MTAKVSYTIATYWKRPRGEAGLTSVTSKRLDVGQALSWIIQDLPAEALDTAYDETADTSIITIRWAQVPAEIREGTRAH